MRAASTYVFLAIFLLLSAGGYYVYYNHQSALMREATLNHESIARGFVNSVWKMHSYKMMPLITSGKDIADEVDTAIFTTDAAAYFHGMHVHSVQIYGPAKQLVISLPEGKTPAKADNEMLAQVPVLKGTLNNTVSGEDGAPIIQSVVPVMQDGVVQLMLVISSDIAAENSAFILAIAGLIGAVLLLSLCIYIFSNASIRRAETLIAKQYEENADLVNQAAIAKEETKQKSQFLANITHELRTPLNAIIGFSEILKNEFIPAPGQGNHTNYINDIHSAGSHLLSLINDILDYSKAEAGKLELEVTEVNVVKMIQNSMRLVQPRAELAQVKLLESLPKTQVTIMTDGKKFKQVLLNLLSNAVKFTPAGGSVKVSVWEDMQNDMWAFEVRDSGIGIAPKDISRAMAPFGQVDNALSRKFEGTGLGLPLTKKFVELLGGKFVIDSEPGKGTAVTFSLPREFKPLDGTIFKHVA